MKSTDAPFKTRQLLALFFAGLFCALLSGGCATVSTDPMKKTPEYRSLIAERERLAAQLGLATLLGQDTSGIAQRLREIDNEISLLRERELKLGIVSLKDLEKEKQQQGLPIDRATISIFSMNVDPIQVEPGDNTVVTCKYEAFGGGVATAPTCDIRLFYEDQELINASDFADLYTGIYWFTYTQTVPEEAPPGEYEFRITMRHGNTSAEKRKTFTVLP